jgi:hypothetical protein
VIPLLSLMCLPLTVSRESYETGRRADDLGPSDDERNSDFLLFDCDDCEARIDLILTLYGSMPAIKDRDSSNLLSPGREKEYCSIDTNVEVPSGNVSASEKLRQCRINRFLVAL